LPLSLARTRGLLALRINVLAKGYAGISLINLQKMIDCLNGASRHARIVSDIVCS
jgi:histidine ammonia-lyase